MANWAFKKTNSSQFEDQLDQQYRVISMMLPVDILNGKKVEEADKNKVRELVYNYLDLSNEQVYLRAKKRITKITWSSWNSGIKAHLEKTAFRDVYLEVKSKSGLTYLERLVEGEFKTDPIDWYRG